MNRRDAFDDTLRDWAELGDGRLPGRYLDAALTQIDRTPQRGVVRWRLQSFTIKRTPATLAILGLSALVVTLGIAALGPRLVGPPSVTPHASPSAAALTWSPDRAEQDWPGPVRSEPPGELLRTTLEARGGTPGLPFFADPSDDVPLAPDWVDITEVRVNFVPNAATVGSTVEFDLAGEAPSAIPHPEDIWVAYGMVVDVDSDGQGDLRLGMDNAPGGEHRAWWTVLSTGVTSAATGTPYGYVGRFFFDTFLPGESPSGLMTFSAHDVGDFKFYVWSSMIVDGKVVATDYAPNIGWVDPGASTTTRQEIEP